jgi:hypothetical protein
MIPGCEVENIDVINLTFGETKTTPNPLPFKILHGHSSNQW